MAQTSGSVRRRYMIASEQVFEVSTVTPANEWAAEKELSDKYGGYIIFQLAAMGSATIELYSKLSPDMPYAKVDTVTVTSVDGFIKAYFEVPFWAFKVTAVSGGPVRMWARYDD